VVLWGTIGVVLVVALVALAVMWPSGPDVRPGMEGLAVDPVEAHVEDVTLDECSYDPASLCRTLTGAISEGERSGEVFTIEQSTDLAGKHPARGDDILVVASEVADGTTTYNFYDYERSGSLIWLVVIFAVAVVALGRWRGLGALGGLVASVVLLVTFMIPALLDGSNAVVVSLVAAVLIATVALVLAHGVNIATAVALVSSLTALAVTGLLAFVFIRVGDLTGFTDDDTLFLSALRVPVDPRGLLLAGIVIGSLGVLDDVVVTQVSSVWELRRLHPDAEAYSIYERALRIGRDHISSTVNTLVLAYAGASLSLLLVFAQTGRSLASVVTSEVVATEIIRALVGSIGLVASVPISTWLAAVTLRTREGPAPARMRYPKPHGRRPRFGEDDWRTEP
jgi:uncharacterized membrane protein